MSIATQEAYMKYKDKKAFKVWEGFMPLIFICDPKLIQEITVRDYDKFTNRRFVANGECFNTGLISAQDAQWKKARSAVSNAFTSAKLRQMTPTINQCIERLLDVVNKKDCQVVDFRQLFQSFALDTSFSCIYGTKVDDIYNPRHPLRVQAEESSLDPNLRVICGLMFPEIFDKINATCFAPSVVRFWESLYRNLMKQKRKTCFAERADWMQHFTKALEENSEKTLTETEIIGNAITLTQAAYVSGGGALMFCSYFLAKHPEVQEKVFEELKTVDDINHDTIGQLKYLKCCIFETLRLYPPMERMERQSKTNYQLGDTGKRTCSLKNVTSFVFLRKITINWKIKLKYKSKQTVRDFFQGKNNDFNFKLTFKFIYFILMVNKGLKKG